MASASISCESQRHSHASSILEIFKIHTASNLIFRAKSRSVVHIYATFPSRPSSGPSFPNLAVSLPDSSNIAHGVHGLSEPGHRSACATVCTCATTHVERKPDSLSILVAHAMFVGRQSSQTAESPRQHLLLQRSSDARSCSSVPACSSRQIIDCHIPLYQSVASLH